MSSDTEDMPDLVESSDEEITSKMASNWDYADAWLSSRRKHLPDYHHSLRKCSFCPLLFGVKDNVPKMWITALHQCQLLVTKNREQEVTPLNKDEWELTDIFAEIFNLTNPKMKSREHLKSALDAVDDVERLASTSKNVLDVKAAIERAQNHKAFKSLWESLSGKTRMKKNTKAAQFSLLYIFKNFHYHVLGYGRDGKLIENEIKAGLSSNKSLDDADQLKEKGNKDFKANKFDKAVRWYSQAIKKDPLNHIYYGNRSQAYLKMKKYREALSDGLRAITLDQDWAKGYYRYAEAYFELGMLDKAREVNHQGMQACKRTDDSVNSKQLDEQGERFKTEKIRLEQLEKKDWKNRTQPDLVSDSNDSEGENDVTPGLISDNEDDCPPVKGAKLLGKDFNRKKKLRAYKGLLTSGTDEYLNDHADEAMSHFQHALEIYASERFLRESMKDEDFVVLKYAFGISCVKTHTSKNIQEAVTTFRDLYNKHKFPACYYGLGKAYVTLNRFPEALKPINSGLAHVKNGMKGRGYCWPGTDKLIPETKKDKLESLLKQLLEICKYPPSPDAMCRHRTCLEPGKEAIYVADPDYKGFVRVNCQSMCVVEFHNTCWKAFKSSSSTKTTDKEQLDQTCPTPDCTAHIHEINIYRQDGTKKGFTSDKPLPKIDKSLKKLQKLEPSSQEKISRKAEKKAIRKQKRQEARDKLAQDEEESKKSEDITTESPTTSLAQQVLQDETDMSKLSTLEPVMYKKEDTDETLYKGKQKTSKQKKKKEKMKQVLAVDINFADKREDTLLGEHSVMNDDEKSMTKPRLDFDNPFSIPVSMQGKIRDFESLSDPQKNQHNEVANNLFVYFAELLGEHGPLHINDSVLEKELEDFPPEARDVIDTYGGLKGFLQQSLKFGLIDDFVCLLRDAVKARKLAMAYKQEFPDLAPKQFSAVVQSDLRPRPSRCVDSNMDVNKTGLNPTASEFRPFENGSDVFSKHSRKGDSSTIDQLVKSATNVPKVSYSGYNSLDDFTIPAPSCVQKEASGMTLLENMDDIDDTPLVDDDLEEIGGSYKTVDWSSEKWTDGIDDISDSISLSRGKMTFPRHSETRSLCSIKSDELDPSRCSSRSSHSELGDIDLGYRTGSPAVLGMKSAYSKNKEPLKDVFSNYSSDIFQSNEDISDIRKTPDNQDIPIPPHPFLSSTSKDSFRSFDSRPNSCPMTSGSAISGGGDVSVSSIWSTDATPLPLTGLPGFTQTQTTSLPFTSFQDQLNKKAEQSSIDPFSSQISPSLSSVWSNSDGLGSTQSETPFPAPSTPYTLFGGLGDASNSLTKTQPGLGKTSDWPCVKPSIQEMSTQTEVLCLSVGSNTDFDMPTVQHYQAMQNQHAQLMTRLRTAEEEKLVLNSAIEQYMQEKMKMEQNQSVLAQQISQLKQQMQALQHHNHGLEESVKQKEQKLEEFNQCLMETREQSAQKIGEARSSQSQLQHKLQAQTDRAETAERDYLQMKLQVSAQPFTSAKREAIFHKHHVANFVQKCKDEQKDIPAKTKDIMLHLKSVVDTCDASMVDIKRQFEANLQKLNEGRQLGELPPLSVTTPPTPMPQEIATLMSQIFGSNSSSSKMRLSPTEPTPPKPLTVLSPPDQTAGLSPISPPTKMNGALVQPKPLQPLGAGLGKNRINMPMPAPITNGFQSSAAGTSASKNSFERLISLLQNVLPSHDRKQIIQLVHQLRESRGGSLSGVGLEEIVRNVMEIVYKKQQGSVPSSQSSTSETSSVAPPPGLSSVWSFSNPFGSKKGGFSQSDIYVEEENPCAICHEELEVHNSRNLDCGHRFHTECIRTWFREQSTCPNCRVHALLADDFPTLA